MHHAARPRESVPQNLKQVSEARPPNHSTITSVSSPLFISNLRLIHDDIRPITLEIHHEPRRQLAREMRRRVLRPRRILILGAADVEHIPTEAAPEPPPIHAHCGAQQIIPRPQILVLLLGSHLVRQLAVVEEVGLGVEAQLALVFGPDGGLAVVAVDAEGVVVPHAFVVRPGRVGGELEGHVAEDWGGAGIGGRHAWLGHSRRRR